jgi:hypothetical protein
LQAGPVVGMQHIMTDARAPPPFAPPGGARKDRAEAGWG